MTRRHPAPFSAADISSKDKARFFSYVDALSVIGCWVWKGAFIGRTNKVGHLRIGKHKRNVGSIGYVLYKGQLKSGESTIRICSTQLCCHPDHVKVVKYYGIDGYKYRFLDNVEQKTDTGCWNWKLSLDSSGYGSVQYESKSQKAHRVSYKLFVGDIPDKMLVCHKCDNRACVNPDHLFLGTAKDNSDDMKAKGREQILRGEKNPRAKLTEMHIHEIRRLRLEGCSQARIAEIVGINQTVVSQILLGKAWSHVKALN